MNNVYQLTAVLKKNDGTECKVFKVIRVHSYEGFLEAIWFLARIIGLRNYKKSKRAKYGYPIRKVHRHYYENGVIRVQPLEIEDYN